MKDELKSAINKCAEELGDELHWGKEKMKTEITLNRKQFERWVINKNVDLYRFETMKNAWQSLVEESEKPERVEAWAVRLKDGKFFGAWVGYEAFKYASETASKCGGEIIKLLEEGK